VNNLEDKGRSPFLPDQPVPYELFAGRLEQITHIMERGVGQVERGKPVTIYLEGDYGIGKTSLAKFTQYLGERDHSLLSIYTTLAGAKTIGDIGAAVLQATIETRAYDPKVGEQIRDAFSKYIKDVNVFGMVTLNMAALKKDAPEITQGLLPFLASTLARVRDCGFKGIFLVLDEINGIASNIDFAHFLKATVDKNAAVSKDLPALPLLLMLCGVAARRKQIIDLHEPVARIFDVVSIDRLSNDEVQEFFRKSFEQTARMKIEPKALQMFVQYSGGLPKIMHLLGDAAYWLDDDGVIDAKDAADAVITAANEVGKKYVDHQVFAALKSDDYRSILNKIAKKGPEMSFTRSKILSQLTEPEKGKFDNFLQRMKSLNVILSGSAQGEFVFTSTMARVYIWLQASREAIESKRPK
jgi:Cdc6-like AAA superfamily ATPase